MLVLRAIRWWRDLERLGVRLPLFVVHDLGLLYAVREHVEISGRPGLAAILAGDPALSELVKAYQATTSEIGRSEPAACAASMRLGDDLVVVLLARVLLSVARRVETAPPWPGTLPLDAELVRDLEPQLPTLYAAAPRAYERHVLETLVRTRLHVLTVADALDTGTLRLLGMLGNATASNGSLAQVDWLAALSRASANDIVNFSLELLPRMLETRTAHSASTHAVHGYAGVGRQGSIDSMVLTELSWDEDELSRRLVDGEVLYYTREQARDEARRLHCIVIDASASMRGEREVFARGLAIALGKKLQLGGQDVWMRFFDSRLYDVQRARDRSQLPAAWLLSFKGERGRNPAKVFAQLATEMALLRLRDQRDPIVHLITHAALRVPRPLVQEVRRQAHLFGVFILPSGGTLDLQWLDLLEGHAIVDHATLQQRGARAALATKIVDEAARASVPPATRTPPKVDGR